MKLHTTSQMITQEVSWLISYVSIRCTKIHIHFLCYVGTYRIELSNYHVWLLTISWKKLSPNQPIYSSGWYLCMYYYFSFHFRFIQRRSLKFWRRVFFKRFSKSQTYLLIYRMAFKGQKMKNCVKKEMRGKVKARQM